MDPTNIPGFENLMKSLSGDENLQKQANQLWKMLDNMAESDPDEYKKFVETNIKSGMEDIKKEEQTKKEKKMRKISKDNFYIRMDYTIKKAERQITPKDNLQEKFLINKGKT